MNHLAINQATAVLKAGGLVAFPTETVYGLGADASNESACRRIFAVKGRPRKHPLIVHIASINDLPLWASHISPVAMQLANAFWPGPLTLILKKQPHVNETITGGQDTIGLRIPNHPIAQHLLHAFGGGIAAPSANKFTYISPTTAEDVQSELGSQVDYILDGGACALGLESTIIDMSSDTPRILRPGMISTTMLANVHPSILSSPKALSTASETTSAIRAPGMHHLHYAPRTQTSLIETHAIPQLLQTINHSDLPLALMTHTNTALNVNIAKIHQIPTIPMPNDPHHYAHLLYSTLRRLDHLAYKRIIIEAVPEDAAWDAIRDRLLKATNVR